MKGRTPKGSGQSAATRRGSFGGVLPFSGLLRYDSFDRPVVIRKGSVFVTAGTDRRSSGTHYTPRSLTEPIVQYTLEPLVYIGPAEGKPKEEWELRSVKELLDLKICDMACGSGAFLVQACRYLSERLLEAWERAESEVQPGEQAKLFGGNKSSPPPVVRITPYGMPSTGGLYELIVPVDVAERLAYARRIVAQRCLYGVDKNPLAAEMAKLSIWLLTLAKDKPFTFLDHAIRSGDSLVGIKDLDQLKHFHLEADQPGTLKFKGPLEDWVEDAVALRKKIEVAPANTIEEVQAKERLLVEAEAKTARLRYAADLLLSVEFQDAPNGKERLHNSMAIQAGYYVEKGTLEEFKVAAKKALHDQPTFHWPLEFPEVLVDRGGFDAFICNPPFLGGSRISGVFGDEYLSYLLYNYASTSRNGDLVAFFLRRTAEVLTTHGLLGMITTNSVSQGMTREGSLDYLVDHGYRIIRAIKSYRWPGTANVYVSVLHVARCQWTGPCVLDGIAVESITPYLDAGEDEFRPHRLPSNLGIVFRGSTISGEGFILTPKEAEELIRQDSKSAEVIKSFLTGRDINQHPLQQSERLAIDLGDLSEERAKQYRACWARLYDTVRLQRQGNKLPAREKYWWQYIGRQEALYRAITGFNRVLVCGQVSKYWGVTWVSTGQVFADKVVVFTLQRDGHYAILNSCFHVEWAEKTSSRLKEDPNYNLAKTFETFPLPSVTATLDQLGAHLFDLRAKIMKGESEGLTTLYNAFHDPEDQSGEIQQLRQLHIEVDRAVAAAYGWSDLRIEHSFQRTKQGVRFAISDVNRREVLGRLLNLNHDRYSEPNGAGTLGKRAKSMRPSSNRGRKKSAASGGASLFGEGDEEEPPPAQPRKERTRQVEEPVSRTTPIDQLDTEEIMAALRQATRGRGWLERDELLKEVSMALGYQRLGPKTEEALRGHLRAAIRRRIVEADGASLLRAGTGTMADYGLDELRETFRSVMRKGTSYEREDVIHTLARYLGFARVTDTSRDAIKSAINSAIRHDILGYEGNTIWREE